MSGNCLGPVRGKARPVGRGFAQGMRKSGCLPPGRISTRPLSRRKSVVRWRAQVAPISFIIAFRVPALPSFSVLRADVAQIAREQLPQSVFASASRPGFRQTQPCPRDRRSLRKASRFIAQRQCALLKKAIHIPHDGPPEKAKKRRPKPS